MMRLLHTYNPFRQSSLTHTHPLLSYAIQGVRGGRTPTGLERYSRKVMWIVGGLILAGLIVTLGVTYDPRNAFGDHYIIALLYWVGSLVVSAISFVVVDLVTLFYAAMSVRTEMAQKVKFDLLRTSSLSATTYLDAQITLAQARSWRVFIVMWAARFCCWLLLILLLIIGVIGAVLTGELYFIGWQELAIALLLLLSFCIFTVMLLWEPLWRFRMMTCLAMSIAARVRRGGWMWGTLAAATLLTVFLQGLFGVWVVFTSGWLERIIGRALSFEFEMVTAIAMLLPWLIMPLVVWFSQKQLAGWRWRVAEQAIFARHEELD